MAMARRRFPLFSPSAAAVAVIAIMGEEEEEDVSCQRSLY